MTTLTSQGRVLALAASIIALAYPLSAVADDPVASFATGG
jgi:hypothetical protein